MEKMDYQRLFKQHYGKMFRVARTLLYDRQESEDVVSDIFESLLKSQIVLLPDTEERYLLTSVRNRCLKRLRHLTSSLDGNGKTPNFPSCVEPVDDAGIEDERMTDIVEFVVKHLTEQEQRIFHQRFSNGCSYEEISIAEGISRVSVWKHLSHIIMEIKKQFNPHTL
ncbi:MAG: sigma-70 family RNA polymerase sigma factor [Prevotella sp.]|nr:sigma-70 family RNA polymerase sigma factor [Prevotella sp.]